MDTINHITQGFLLLYIPTGSIPLAAASGIIAGVPDVVGELMAHRYNDNYKWYDSAHRGKINKYMRWVPSWFLHTFQDSYLHKVGKRWWCIKERGWYEILTWIINLILITLVLWK